MASPSGFQFIFNSFCTTRVLSSSKTESLESPQITFHYFKDKITDFLQAFTGFQNIHEPMYFHLAKKRHEFKKKNLNIDKVMGILT